MRTTIPSRAAALAAAGLLLVAACGDDAPSAADRTTTTASGDHPDGAGADETTTPVRRLALADADAARLVLMDLDDPAARTELTLPAPASYSSSTTEDGRLLLLGHDDAVTIVDGGTWSETHGDHVHHFVEDPAVVGSIEGDKPTHLISHHGVTALWFDGSGEAVLLDEERLAEGEVVEEARVPSAGPHHGFAIAHGDDVIMTAQPPAGAEMPERVVVADHAGVAGSDHGCPQTHGEASWPTGAAAACADGVLVLREAEGSWASQVVPYPAVDDTDPYGYGAARAWLLEPVDDGERLVAPLGEHHVLVVDVDAGTASAIDVGAPVAVFGVAVHEPTGLLVVLTDDGAVQLVDPDRGEVLDRVEVLDDATGSEPGGPYRMIAVSDDDVFVADPVGRALAELTITDRRLQAGDRQELGFTPAFLAVLNG